MPCGIWAVDKIVMPLHTGCLMMQLLENLKPIIALGQVQMFMDCARYLKSASEPELCQNHATFVKPCLGQKLLEATHSSQPVIENEAQKNMKYFS
jgi:hypothetical protein